MTTNANSGPYAHTRGKAELPDNAGDDGGLLDIIGDWIGSLSDRIASTTDLAAAEARLAGLSVAAMVVAAMLAALLAFSAYLLAVAGIVLGLARAGISPLTSLSVLAVVHAFLAIFVWQRIRVLSRNLMFSRTRRQFSRNEPQHEGATDKAVER